MYTCYEDLVIYICFKFIIGLVTGGAIISLIHSIICYIYLKKYTKKELAKMGIWISEYDNHIAFSFAWATLSILGVMAFIYI